MVECEMKGFLSLIILWLASKKPVTGSEIATEIEKRKSSRPSPGTIYPALKDLKEKGLLSVDKEKRYTLTKKGEKELHHHVRSFMNLFCDLDDMKKCCN